MSENQAAEAVTEATPQSATVTLGDLGGFIGVKAGMTQIYNDDREAIAVTVIDLQKNVVTQVKTAPTEGYYGVQVGLLEEKEKNSTKALRGHAKKSGGAVFKHYQEFRLDEKDALAADAVGKTLDLSFLKEGDFVDLTAVSKGKGFQGVMKRWNFAGGPASHGASIVHRMPGSINSNTGTGLVRKGKKMAGQMGNHKVTIQNVRVVKVDAENGILLVNGSVPGPKTGLVTISKSVKKARKA